jgi:hypothetical protein
MAKHDTAQTLAQEGEALPCGIFDKVSGLQIYEL